MTKIVKTLRSFILLFRWKRRVKSIEDTLRSYKAKCRAVEIAIMKALQPDFPMMNLISEMDLVSGYHSKLYHGNSFIAVIDIEPGFRMKISEKGDRAVHARTKEDCINQVRRLLEYQMKIAEEDSQSFPSRPS